MIAQFPFLQVLTERDRRWPRLVLMAFGAQLPALIFGAVASIVAVAGSVLYE